MQRYISRKELAELTQTSVSYWAQHAMRRTGPSFRLVGRKALYDPEEIQAWLDKRQVVNRIGAKIGRPRKKRSFGKA